MLQVEELLKEKNEEFLKLKLEAGKEGLKREISWPNTILTLPIAEWLLPGEMVIISGVGMNAGEYQILEMVEQAVAGKASCLIFMLNCRYISAIPDCAKIKANELKLPLFSAPWDLSLGVLMSEVSSMIMKRHAEEQVISQLLTEVLFHDADEESCIERAKFYGYDLLKPHRVIVIKIDNMRKILEGRRFTEEEIYKYKRRIWKFADSSLRREKIRGIGDIRKSTIFYIGDFPLDEKEEITKVLERLSRYLTQEFPELNYRIGFSGRCRQICEYPRGMREANTALSITLNESLINSYEDTGVLQLLLAHKSTQQLKGIYESSLGKLLAEESRTQVELVETLEEYLKNNGNVVKTAGKLYIHRNTLLNRLEKIRQCLDIDLEDAYVRNNLFNTLIIGKYI